VCAGLDTCCRSYVHLVSVYLALPSVSRSLTSMPLCAYPTGLFVYPRTLEPPSTICALRVLPRRHTYLLSCFPSLAKGRTALVVLPRPAPSARSRLPVPCCYPPKPAVLKNLALLRSAFCLAWVNYACSYMYVNNSGYKNARICFNRTTVIYRRYLSWSVVCMVLVALGLVAPSAKNLQVVKL
jgi:hypothetical protein